METCCTFNPLFIEFFTTSFWFRINYYVFQSSFHRVGKNIGGIMMSIIDFQSSFHRVDVLLRKSLYRGESFQSSFHRVSNYQSYFDKLTWKLSILFSSRQASIGVYPLNGFNYTFNPLFIETYLAFHLC